MDKKFVVDEEAFAKVLGFDSWSDLMNASEHIVSEGDIDWWVTQLPDGRWAAWDDKELAAERVERFDTREEAINFQREGFEASDLPEEYWILEK